MNVEDNMQLTNGHRLQEGKYRIEKKIGQGGFGVTYLARWYQKLQGEMGVANSYSMVVIKEFFWSKYCNREADGYTVSISSAEGKEMMAQFKEKLKKEGKFISKLSHPNIVRILNIFEENNTAYLVMEYIEGESLSDIIRKQGKLDEPTVLKYAGQICSALTEIHSKRILHLDIKPSNVLIDENDNVQIIDFGVSKQYDETSHETSDTPIGVSAGYSPIEQYGTLKSFSPPTDIYALGATLYKMITGETPIEATDRNRVDLEPVTRYSPNVGKKTEEAIAKAMSEKIRDRYQSAEELWKALEYGKKPDTPQNGDETVIEVPKESPETIPDETIVEKPQRNSVTPPKPPEAPSPHPEDPKQGFANIGKIIVTVAGAAIVLLLAVIFFSTRNKNSAEGSVQETQPIIANNPPAIAADTVVQTQPAAPVAQPPAVQTPPPLRNENDAKKQEEQNKQKAAQLVQQANAAFNGKGVERYEKSYQLYKQAKDLGGNVSAGYNNFLSKAKTLIEKGAGFDESVKMLLQYAQRLNNTQEVRDLLANCK